MSDLTAQLGTTAGQIDILRFTIEDEHYGVELLKVLEVIRLVRISKLPQAPKFVKGIINLRGKVIPIVDLREKFGLDALAYSATTRAILIEINKQQIGVVVDKVNQVSKVAQESIQEPPAKAEGLSSDFINGVCQIDEDMIMMLDIERILTQHELEKLNQAVA